MSEAGLQNSGRSDRPALVIIPCLNEELHLGALVDNLLRQAAAARLHIVIADGGSSDRTVSIAKDLAAKHAVVTFLDNPGRLQSAAINLAVAQYGDMSDNLIRIDAHADYPDDYCAVLVAEQLRTQADSVVVSMDTIGKGGFQQAVAAAQNSKLGNGGAAHRNATDGMWVDHGHHALMRVEAFRAVGGYDESFSHNEDAELDIRLRRAGCKIWLTAKTGLIYYPRAAPGPLFRQYYNFGRGRARTLLKHRARPRLRQLIPVAVAPALLFALATPFTRWAAVPLLFWAAFCVAYGAWRGVRTGHPGAAAMAVPAMIMHLAWSLGFWRAGLAALPGRPR